MPGCRVRWIFPRLSTSLATLSGPNRSGRGCGMRSTSRASEPGPRTWAWSLVSGLAAAPLLGCRWPSEDPPTPLAERFASDPASVIAELRELSDPMVRAEAILQVVEAHPGESRALCDLIEVPAAARRCDRFNSRAHLWVDPESGAPGTPRARGGEAVESTDAESVPASLVDRWAQVAARSPDCKGEGWLGLCISFEASRAAAAGNVDKAGATCLSLEDLPLRQDCFFLASESVPM